MLTAYACSWCAHSHRVLTLKVGALSLWANLLGAPTLSVRALSQCAHSTVCSLSGCVHFPARTLVERALSQ